MSELVYLKHPFTMLISGPTGSGKTVWVKNLIENNSKFCLPPPQRIIYCYGEYQSIFSTFKKTTFIPGLPDNIIDMFDGTKPEWLIIDDLMLETANSTVISEIFTKGSHHRNLAVILIVQNFFMRGKESRNISLNCQYIVLFKNPRDQSIATNIARQMFPAKIKKFQAIYEDATREPFSYLFIDLKPYTPVNLRLLSNIQGENGYMIAYQL